MKDLGMTENLIETTKNVDDFNFDMEERGDWQLVGCIPRTVPWFSRCVWIGLREWMF